MRVKILSWRHFRFFSACLSATVALCFALTLSASENFKRKVSLDWEPVEGAQSYDLEIQKVVPEGTESEASEEGPSEKSFLFKTEFSKWGGKLTPGSYTMRLRANDSRGVPGEWSEAAPFHVKLSQVVLLTPKHKEKLQAEGDETQEVLFQWEPVVGAAKYTFEIFDQKKQLIEKRELTENELKMELPVAAIYRWKVSTVDLEGNPGDTARMRGFLLIGKQLEQPEIEQPPNPFVRQLVWSQPTGAQTFKYTLLRKSEKSGKWKKVARNKSYLDQRIPFEEKFRGGRYKLKVKAKAKWRKSSKYSELEFDVASGDRSPAAEDQALLKDSIVRHHPLYAIASYLASFTRFENVFKEDGGGSIDNSAPDAISIPRSNNREPLIGTGRLGMGYDFSGTPWGIFSILDLGGTLINSKVNTFASAEITGVWTMPLWGASDLRFQFGPYYKEFLSLAIKKSATTSEQFEISTMAVMGPHIGVEYWQPISSSLGFQFNTHFYYSMAKSRTPNGRDNVPALSSQFGILGSLKLRRSLTGYAGYAFRKDVVKYQATPKNNADNIPSLANEGDINSITLTGHYINLLMEYEF